MAEHANLVSTNDSEKLQIDGEFINQSKEKGQGPKTKTGPGAKRQNSSKVSITSTKAHLSSAVTPSLLSSNESPVLSTGTLSVAGTTAGKTHLNNLSGATIVDNSEKIAALTPANTPIQLNNISTPEILSKAPLITSLKDHKLSTIPQPVLSTTESIPSNKITFEVNPIKISINRKRAATDETQDLETSSNKRDSDDTIKDDEEEEDEGDDEKTVIGIDQERLKAFNMFVRLFVDENLDRIIPISKQPKDKIQAILDACDRQFPEFHERSRKRIRTYLKSCRRMRKSKDNGWEAMKPTPPHLTSAAAETLLAQACENETLNAKRMKMGLEPLPAKNIHMLPIPQNQPGMVKLMDEESVSLLPNVSEPLSGIPRSDNIVASMPCTAKALQTPPDMNSLYQKHNSVFLSSLASAQNITGVTPIHNQKTNNISNGPTDLSMKKPATSGSGTVSDNKKQLNATEVTTIRQLISGYRESAAFLYRSADELEQLLFQQN